MLEAAAAQPMGGVLVLSGDEIASLMTPGECIPVMAELFRALVRGEVHLPLRTIVRPPEAKGLLGMMPAYCDGQTPWYGVKVAGLFPGNSAVGLDPHQGCVLLMSGTTGELRAMMDATAITALRTAAVSALATRTFARQDACRLALVGCGHQAAWHLAALAAVLPLERVAVAGRSIESATRFAQAESSRYGFAVEAAASVREAVSGADIVVTLTNAREPVLAREWIAPGTHLTVVGASTPASREIDEDLMVAATLFVDRRESTLNESGEYLAAARAGRIGPEHLRAELGEVLLGRHPGRTRHAEITLFKSLGMGAQDMAAAVALLARAEARNTGTRVRL